MFSDVLLSMFLSCPHFENNCKHFFWCGVYFFLVINMCTFFFLFVLISVLCIQYRVFTCREIFALFFTYSLDTDNSSVNLCNKYNALHRSFWYQRKNCAAMFLVCSWFVLLCLVCSRFVPCEGQVGVYRICICTLQHTRFWVLPYFSVYKGLHTVIIM